MQQSDAETLMVARRLHRHGEFARAAETYRRLLAAHPNNPELHYLLASACRSQGDISAAIAGYERAIALKAGFAEAHNSLGAALAHLGRLAEAEACFRRAVDARPEFAHAHNNLGNVLKERSKTREAEACYRKAIALQPNFADAHNNLGNVLRELGRPTEALAACEAALALNPQMAEAHNNRGAALAALGRWPEAIASFRQAIMLQPLYPDAHGNLGNALRELGRFDEAALSLREAVRLQPGSSERHHALAIAQLHGGDIGEALTSCRTALRLDPQLVGAHISLGYALSELGQFSAALDCYQRALEIDPDAREAKKNRALVRLLLGNFADAWPDYEARWGSKELPHRPFPQPLWDGAPLEGRRIFIHAEQGLGDTLQFVRYLPLVKACGGKVLFACAAPLHPLLAEFGGIDRLLPQDEPLPPFDVHAPLLSLPRIFGTRVETIPAPTPYVSVSRDLIDDWSRELGSIHGFRVGIAWQGSKAHQRDRERSIPLTCFEALARMPGVRLIALQKGEGREQLDALAGRIAVEDLGSRYEAGDFRDTAAVMKNLDLVVTCDTAVGHLAGALAVPGWLALPFVPDWRWLLDRDDSPWYASVRLFRQQRRGDWSAVFVRIEDALLALLTRRTTPKDSLTR